jgi:hypothetical protein
MGRLVKGCLGLAGLVVVVAVIISVIAAVGGGSASSDKSTSASSGGGAKPKPKAKSGSGGLNSDAGVPNRVKVGAAFRLGDFTIQKGWKIHKAGFGMGYELKNFNVQNMTGSDHQFDVEVKLHKGTHRIVSDMGCITVQLVHPKEIVTPTCVPDGSGGSYDYVTIENTL